MLPRKIDIRPSEMTVSCGLTIDRPQQIKVPDNGSGPEIENPADSGGNFFITGDAGTGKTFTIKNYIANTRQAYLLCCNEYWNRKMFLSELLTSLGRDYTGFTVGEMMHEAVRTLKMQESPLLILDEADKLSDQVLYFFITLYNQLEDECGIVLCATNHLCKRIERGIKLNKKGYNEIWSRLGRRCIELKGVSAADITAICEANGITASDAIDNIINDSEGDLRRVRRKIHATLGQMRMTA